MKPSSVSISFLEGSAGEIQGTSGIKIAQHLIITNGILLKSKIRRSKKLLDFIMKLNPGELTSLNVEPDDLRVQVMSRKSPRILKTKEMPGDEQKIEESCGLIYGVWKCPLLADTLETLFHGWTFNEAAQKTDKELLSIFLIISTGNNEEIYFDEIQESLVDLLNVCSLIQTSGRGAHVLIESTPFGNPVFIDSISRGIVSNVLGTDQCVMLTDANAVPGCEGGPVYVIQHDETRLAGMVIAPLSWCGGEWVEYTLVACLTTCLKKLLRSNTIISSSIINNPEVKLTELLDKSVVLIRCGSDHGSGIFLDRKSGTILTCSHVIKEAPDQRIRVILRPNDGQESVTSTTVWAKLVYRTPGGRPYDLAVLKVDAGMIDPTLRPLKIADGDAERGEMVIGAGFPFFSATLPTFTRGNVSRVSRCMLQTTCCVQSGASGGPIVRTSTGELLGIVVCNVITSKTLYPKLNMAVPASIIKGPIYEYIKTGCVDVLQDLTTRDKSIEQAWNFHLPSKF